MICYRLLEEPQEAPQQEQAPQQPGSPLRPQGRQPLNLPMPILRGQVEGAMIIGTPNRPLRPNQGGNSPPLRQQQQPASPQQPQQPQQQEDEPVLERPQRKFRGKSWWTKIRWYIEKSTYQRSNAINGPILDRLKEFGSLNAFIDGSIRKLAGEEEVKVMLFLFLSRKSNAGFFIVMLVRNSLSLTNCTKSLSICRSKTPCTVILPR